MLTPGDSNEEESVEYLWQHDVGCGDWAILGISPCLVLYLATVSRRGGEVNKNVVYELFFMLFLFPVILTLRGHLPHCIRDSVTMIAGSRKFLFLVYMKSHPHEKHS